MSLLSDQSIRYKRRTVKVKDFTAKFLEEALSKGDEKDLSILIIEIEKGKQKRRYTCKDYYDEKNRMWFLSSNSLLYEELMENITIRAKRGTLEELVFENFSFNMSTEVNMIGYNCIKQFNLELDFHQIRQ